MTSQFINPKDSFPLQPLPQTPAFLKTGEILVNEGLISREDVNRVLTIQRQGKASPLGNSSRLFGMILCDLNLITPIDNYCVLQKYGKLRSMDEMLVKGQISSTALKLARQEAKLSDTPFFTLILNQGIVTLADLQKLLYNLYRIPYRTIQDFRLDHNKTDDLTTIIDKHLALEKRMIPLVRQEKVVLIGITEPDALLTIKKISAKFPLIRFKAVFIPFSGFKTLFNLLYGEKEKSFFQERSPDISLLLNFRITITDPDKEQEKILSLHGRYETIRTLTCEGPGKERSKDFKEFIASEHKRITSQYGIKRVEYFLRKKNQNLFIIALPQGLNQSPCQG